MRYNDIQNIIKGLEKHLKIKQDKAYFKACKKQVYGWDITNVNYCSKSIRLDLHHIDTYVLSFRLTQDTMPETFSLEIWSNQEFYEFAIDLNDDLDSDDWIGFNNFNDFDNLSDTAINKKIKKAGQFLLEYFLKGRK